VPFVDQIEAVHETFRISSDQRVQIPSPRLTLTEIILSGITIAGLLPERRNSG